MSVPARATQTKVGKCPCRRARSALHRFAASPLQRFAQVNKAITMMDEVTQQNAALVEQATATAQALSDQAANLAQLIAHYHVDEGGSADVAHATVPQSRGGRQPTPTEQ
jgi:methyl-accepting chemotaxis protein